MATAKTRKRYHDLVKKRKIDYTSLNREDPDFQNRFDGAMMDLHYEGKEKDFKKQTVAFAKSNDIDWKALNTLEDRHFAVIGKYTTILNGGGQLPEKYEIGFDQYMQELVELGQSRLQEKQEAKANDDSPTMTVQDHVRAQATLVSEVFDLWIDTLISTNRPDQKQKPDPVRVMQSSNFSSVHRNWIKRFYSDEIEDIKSAIEGTDQEAKEAYAGYSKAKLKRIQEFLTEIVNAAEMVSKAKKATRKPRKKKEVSSTKKVEKLKFQAQDNTLGIASEPPANIVGASQVWVYNTKLRKLIRFVAADSKGIDVSGTTLKNISTELSVQKTVRKPKEVLGEFMKAGKVKLRKFMDGIKAVESKPTGRLNEHCVILKAIK